MVNHRVDASHGEIPERGSRIGATPRSQRRSGWRSSPIVQLHLLRCGILQADSSPNDLATTADSLELSNTIVLPQTVETISLKLTKEQAKLLAKASKDRGFPSKSEFVRYAIARALEDRLSVKTIEIGRASCRERV